MLSQITATLWRSPSYAELAHCFFLSVSGKPTQHSNGQQQHCQHSTSQEAGGTAEDGSQHRQDKGKDDQTPQRT